MHLGKYSWLVFYIYSDAASFYLSFESLEGDGRRGGINITKKKGMIIILALAVMISISPIIISFHANAVGPSLLNEVMGDEELAWSDASSGRTIGDASQLAAADGGLDNTPHLKMIKVNGITYTTINWTELGWAFANPGFNGMMSAAESEAFLWNGSGTEADPYLINNAEDLASLSDEVNGNNAFAGTYFLMTADIDLGVAPYNTGWTSIGNSSSNSFRGIFNGGGHVIQSLTVVGTNNYAGLFGYIGTGGVVKDLGIDENSTVSGGLWVGGVVGCNFHGTVANCYNMGSVIGRYYVGGVVGFSDGGTTENCYNTGPVRCANYVGGVVGRNYGAVTNCYNAGSVNGADYVGGVVGDNYSGTVANCYNTGSISSDGYGVGGVVGLNCNTVANCYNTGPVSSTGEDVGGVVGMNDDTVTNCYNTGSVSGTGGVGGVVGWNNNSSGAINMCYYNSETGPDNGFGVGLTTSQMTADAVLTGAMSVLGPAFEKRGNDANLYYPELAVFKNSADPAEREASRLSVIAGTSWNGSGTEADPYLINNAEDLARLSDEVNGGNAFASTYFLVTADIDLGVAPYNTGWIPIGNNNNVFRGIFNGGGHVIQGLTINGTDYYVGLFGYIGTGGVVKDLVIDKNSIVRGTNNIGSVAGYSEGMVADCCNMGSVRGSNYVGGVVGYNLGVITDCCNAGLVSYGYFVGGVAGYNGGTVTNCYNTGSISGGNYHVGGVAGQNYGTVANSYNMGSVVGTGYYVGGVAGSNFYLVTNCYNTGSVAGTNDVGGVVGNNYFSTVSNCYSAGSVIGTNGVGGVIGRNSYGTVGMCYYNTDTYTGPDNGFGTGLTTAQMTADDVLIGSMSDLGPAFEKRENDADLYYPELAVFKNSADPAVREASRLSVIAGTAWNGSGTETDPYLINNAEDLARLSDEVNGGNDFAGAYFLMTADIDLGVAPYNTGWTPIGNSSSNPFRGNFNGGSHVIQSLTVVGTNINVGLFGRVVEGGVLKDLGIDENSTVSGGYYVGGVVGYNYYGTVENCYNMGSVGSNNLVGGVVGYSFEGAVTNCYNAGSVNGSGNYVGGVIGYNGGAVTNCYNAGSVNGSGNYVGGVAGYNLLDSTVSNCYNTGPVSGIDNVGGVAGRNSNGTVENCYNTASVGGTNDVGGVVGYSYDAIEMCYYNKDTYTGPDNGFGTGLTTAQMTADAVLTGAMSGLGSAFEKRMNDGNLYYPELFVFKESTDPAVREASRLSVIAVTAWSGSGTETNPYLVNNAEDLARLSDEVNSGNAFAGTYFLVTADIDLGVAPFNTGWTPIGKDYFTSFRGNFDGGSHVIQSLTVIGTNDYAGLFGHVGAGGVVKNLSVDENSTVSGYNIVGGVVGWNNGTVTDCFNMGSVSGTLRVGGVAGSNGGILEICYNVGPVSGSNRIGGVVGVNNGGTATSCYNIGPVSGTDDVGGVAGDNYTSVTNCYNMGSLNGTNNVGGVVGYNTGSVTDCYNAGPVSGTGNYFGGVVGYCISGSGSVISCYNTGPVGGTNDVGGVVGYNYYGTIGICYYNKDTYTGPDNGYGMGLTTSQMTADAVLTGTMSGLGPAFEKRGNDSFLYYPELAVFKNSADPGVRETSRLSVIAGTN